MNVIEVFGQPMRVLFLLLAVGLAACEWTELRIDASSEAKFVDSMSEVFENLDAEKRKEFSAAILRIDANDFSGQRDYASRLLAIPRIWRMLKGLLRSWQPR